MLGLMLTAVSVAASYGPLHPAPSCTIAAPFGEPVPAEFASNRIFVDWHLNGLGTLRLYTDTGGGAQELFASAIQRLHITVDTFPETHGVALVARIPKALGNPLFPRIPDADSASFGFLVSSTPAPEDDPDHAWDGRLSNRWFGGHVWMLDYPHGRMFVADSSAGLQVDPACWVPLGFQVDSTTRERNLFPRISAVIAGQQLQFLLDTGARTILTANALSRVAPAESRYRATSFITTTRFEQWHQQHPDWEVIAHAEAGTDSASMIRVPSVQVGNQSLGPVWFTERPDGSFTTFMSQYTDEPIEGSLGGSAWRYGTLIIDYPKSRAAVVSLR